ncbi:MAG: hypothetical protein Q7S19_02260 [bacterium]|nr:hypothetical protein [bacterium]
MSKKRNGKKRGKKKPEIIDLELPLQEIVPDNNKEKQRQHDEEAAIRDRLLNDPNAIQDIEEGKKKPSKTNKTRKSRSIN